MWIPGIELRCSSCFGKGLYSLSNLSSPEQLFVWWESLKFICLSIPAFLCRLNFCLNVYYKDIFIVFAFLGQRGFYFTTRDVISYLLSWLPRMIHLWYFLSVFPIFSGGCHVFSLWQMFCNLTMIFCLRHPCDLLGFMVLKISNFYQIEVLGQILYIYTCVNSSCVLFSLRLKAHSRHSILHLCAEYYSHFPVLTLWL